MNLRAFPEHLQLNPPSTIRHKIVGPDQSLRYLLCFSSRCKDLIKAYISEVKKVIWKILLHIGKNLSKTRRWRTSVVRPKNSWGIWSGGSSTTPRKRLPLI